MALRIYNTLSRVKELFQPLHGKTVGMYTCGPTVYDYPHIGNMKSYVFEDVVKRSLIYLGYTVKHVMNITDVGHLVSDEDTGEDKMEKGAQREGKTVWEIAEFYTKIFFDQIRILNILPPDVICKATDHIPEQIALVHELENKGFTYVIEDGVYFDTSKLADYGKLAKLDIEGLKAGARVEVIKGKKHVTDFALWKFSPKDKKRQMEWESPWGKGFPGWHIECSAMSMKYLGETFDIHCGGVDHIPVHHTNEIAQSEAATGKPFVKYWLHGNHLLVEGEKMAKSKGNFYTLQDLLDKGYSARAIRYLYISSHYRQQQNFTFSALKQAENTLLSLDRFCEEMLRYSDGDENGIVSVMIKKANEIFLRGVSDDFNIPEALKAVFDLTKDVNPLLLDQKMSKEEANSVLTWLKDIDRVLGVLSFEADNHIPEEVIKLVEERETKRKNKDFKGADEVRLLIEKKGYYIKDTSKGTRLEKKR